MRYSLFIPRLYNLLKSLGFEPEKIMPSRAFCSDESQGYPIILLAKHFGTFPFNHGLVGGIVATDRHGPHAHHGKEMLIVQASHVGYDPATSTYGSYRRLQTQGQHETTSCGKICGTINWYINEYKFANQNIFLTLDENNNRLIIIDNKLIHTDRQEGLILNLSKMVTLDTDSSVLAISSLSTSKVFAIRDEMNPYLENFPWKAGEKIKIGEFLHPDLFHFKKHTHSVIEGQDHLENNLLNVMPYVVTSEWPALTAAQANTQVEFDRTFRSISTEPAYQGKKLFFISGLNVDISPQTEQIFPLTKFIPWAAYYRDENNKQTIWEQAELFELLKKQNTENPNQVDLESAINIMQTEDEIKLPF